MYSRVGAVGALPKGHREGQGRPSGAERPLTKSGWADSGLIPRDTTLFLAPNS